MSFKGEVLGGVGRRVKRENRRELEECLDSQASLHPFFLTAPVLAPSKTPGWLSLRKVVGGWDAVPRLRFITSYRSHMELGGYGTESVLWGPKKASSPEDKVSVILKLPVPRAGTRSD